MDFTKLAPELASALGDYERRDRDGLRRRARLFGVVPGAPLRKPARTVAFLRCAPEARFDDLAADGVQVNAEQGRVRTGIVPFASLDALTESPAVERVIPARRLRPLMDIAAERVGLPAFTRATGLSGAGVVVGIVDTGVDPRHPDLAGRVLRVWDQTLRGEGVAEGRYGAELTGEDRMRSRDVEGHGTHVAGIAAGGGTAFPGVAPGAELVVVKTDLLDAHVADGIRYVFRVAAELGRPAVVNLSLGGHADAHDGTDPLSAIIDAETGPGRLVCCAAGNEGDDSIHATLQMQSGPRSALGTAAFVVPAPAGGDAVRLAVVNGWYAGEDRLAFAVEAPSGLATPFQPVITDALPTRSYDLPGGRVRITTPGPDPSNGDHNVLVEVEPSAAPVAPAKSNTWRLRVRADAVASGRVDLWVLDDSQLLDVQFSGPGVADSMKVGSPGAATEALTVGSFTTRNAWTAADGTVQRMPIATGTVSTFSSEGPRRDGVHKPDLVAPGSWIASALSRDASLPRELVLDAEHVVLQGTSMASPFVAGVLALLLERDPDLDPAKARAALRAASAIPDRPPGSFDAKWGHGLLDAAGL